MNYLQKRIKALGHSVDGLKQAMLTEPHMRLHAVVATVVLFFSGLCGISKYEWLMVVLAIVLVFITELLNTAIEKFCNLSVPEPHPTIKFVKDVSAAAVLVAAIFAVCVACAVFWPYVIQYLV